MSIKKKTSDVKKRKSGQNERKKYDKTKSIKTKKIAHNIIGHNVQKHVTNTIKDIEDSENIKEKVAKRVKSVKMSIEGKKLPKNIFTVLIDNASLHSEESVTILKFVYHGGGS